MILILILINDFDLKSFDDDLNDSDDDSSDFDDDSNDFDLKSKDEIDRIIVLTFSLKQAY